MSCFYCGKRVSLVRKRSDADFCCEEHREKYHARTRRGIEALREVEEQMVVSRRLNEGIPVRPAIPLAGKNLDSLLQTGVDSPLPFGWMPTGLPISRANLAIHVPAADRYMHAMARANPAVPPPTTEAMRWNIGRVQETPRPPRAFTMAIRLPQGGLKRPRSQPAACDRPHRLSSTPPVELGVGASRIVCRIARPMKRNSIGALPGTTRPPDPVKPPPASPPIGVVLRHPSLAVRLGSVHTSVGTRQMPEFGLLGVLHQATPAAALPPSPTYMEMVHGDLALPAVFIGAGSMPPVGRPKLLQRFVPNPDSFRRRQYYNAEPLDRFCRTGFETVADHRPDLRVAAAPNPAAHLSLARLWSIPVQDQGSARPEPRRPAPPFRETLRLPQAGAGRLASELILMDACTVGNRAMSPPIHSPIVRPWDGFAGVKLACSQGRSEPISRPRWACATAEALRIPGWVRPQTRGSKRTSCQVRIGVPEPVFLGPEFVAGNCQAGPSPEYPMAAPRFAPPAALVEPERVLAARAAVFPASLSFGHVLRDAGILARGCQAPVGRIAAAAIVYPVYPILLDPRLPAEGTRATRTVNLPIHAPARQMGKAFDIARGLPRRVDRENLDRFRRRGPETLHDRPSMPSWPSSATPGAVAMPVHAPFPHATRALVSEPAAAMFRACDSPAGLTFQRACTLIDWGTMPPAPPGSSDFGRLPWLTGVPLPLNLMLPLDSLGPIRDWGLAAPPEPEQPPEPVHEDFVAGLANWICAANDWRQDIVGVRTGSLALLRPSLNMTDYELEFLCKIEYQSVCWVLRAANASNYQAVQIVLDAAGAAHLVRFSVLGGEREDPAIAPLPQTVTKSSTCRVKTIASGHDFKLFVNDMPAGAWSNSRLPEGGVGFFSDGEDRARLYWVKVTPYYDAPSDQPYVPAAGMRPDFHREIRMGIGV